MARRKKEELTQPDLPIQVSQHTGLIQLDPPIPVEIVENDAGIPVGKGLAHGWIDYGVEHHLLWITFMDGNRQCWAVPNPYVRAQSDPSMGRK